jgi:D-mannonate dehydratase
VSDDARVAISEAAPEDYPTAAAGHVAAVRASANELTGEQGSLAKKVADDLEEASKRKANSVEFTDAYNTFVADSNEFNHAYCNEQVTD